MILNIRLPKEALLLLLRQSLYFPAEHPEPFCKLVRIVLPVTLPSYSDQQTELKQRDVVSELQGALQRAATPEEAKNLQSAIGIYRVSKCC